MACFEQWEINKCDTEAWEIDYALDFVSCCFWNPDAAMSIAHGSTRGCETFLKEESTDQSTWQLSDIREALAKPA